MKTIKNIFKSALLLTGVAFTASSCQDWLTVYPQTQVVEENFWEDKNDLEGVRYAAYKKMGETMSKLMKWGDLRSDSYGLWDPAQMTNSGAKDASRSYRNIRNAMLERDSANTYFDWAEIYTTINYCNKVIYHGPQVLERDKQFTPSEWRFMRAEMVALRALNYFYLIRAYKDVPYTTKVINKDTETQSFAATNQLVVLDSLIADVEQVKGQARTRLTSASDTKGTITNAAIYALLSDMYLWRASLHQGRGLDADSVMVRQTGELVHHTVKGDYQLCADYADLSMASLAKQIEEGHKNYGTSSSYEMVTFGLNNVNLYKNDFTSFTLGSSPSLYAKEAIFLRGNSDESIFELQFGSADSRENGVIPDLFGSDVNHKLTASRASLKKIYANNDDLLNRDSRIWYSCWKAVQESKTDLYAECCFKYEGIRMISNSTSSTTKGKDLLVSTGSSSISSDTKYLNVIIYRLSDVMLQKAEALACMAAMSNDKAMRTEAMKLVNALHRRAYCNDNANLSVSTAPEDVSKVTDTTWGRADATATDAAFGNLPEPGNLKTGSDKWEVAVLNERQIELFGEGKRWFDLVRFAERHAGGQDGTQDVREWTSERPIGNGRAGVNLMCDQFMGEEFTGVEAIKSRLRDRCGLYNLIYYMEIKASEGMLEQNPVWNKSTYEQ